MEQKPFFSGKRSGSDYSIRSCGVLVVPCGFVEEEEEQGVHERVDERHVQRHLDTGLLKTLFTYFTWSTVPLMDVRAVLRNQQISKHEQGLFIHQRT